MLFSKEELQKELKKAKQGALIFFIITMSLFGLAVGLVIAAIIIGSKDANAWFPYAYGAGISMSIAFACLVMRSVFFTAKIRYLIALSQQQEHPQPLEAPVVDAKPVEPFKEENSRENKLYQQYENLYKQGYINKEDLDKKKEEILKK